MECPHSPARMTLRSDGKVEPGALPPPLFSLTLLYQSVSLEKLSESGPKIPDSGFNSDLP
jgi:hypothetical protein